MLPPSADEAVLRPSAAQSVALDYKGASVACALQKLFSSFHSTGSIQAEVSFRGEFTSGETT
jgi:hypothetical protein